MSKVFEAPKKLAKLPDWFWDDWDDRSSPLYWQRDVSLPSVEWMSRWLNKYLNDFHKGGDPLKFEFSRWEAAHETGSVGWHKDGGGIISSVVASTHTPTLYKNSKGNVGRLSCGWLWFLPSTVVHKTPKSAFRIPERRFVRMSWNHTLDR